MSRTASKTNSFRRTLQLLLFIVLALFVGACTSASSETVQTEKPTPETEEPKPQTPTAPPGEDPEIMTNPVLEELEAGETIIFSLGETAWFNGNLVMLRYVSDERCPTHQGVACDWEGALRATIAIDADEYVTEGFEGNHHGSNPYVWFQIEDDWFRLTAEGFSPLGERAELHFRIDPATPVSATEAFGEPTFVDLGCDQLRLNFEGDQVFSFRIADPRQNAMPVGHESVTDGFLPGRSTDERPGTLFVGNADPGECQSTAGVGPADQEQTRPASGDAVYLPINGTIHQTVISDTAVTIEFTDLVLVNETDPDDVYVLNVEPITVNYGLPQ